jgi:uncharacterized UPF0160 family protein
MQPAFARTISTAAAASFLPRVRILRSAATICPPVRLAFFRMSVAPAVSKMIGTHNGTFHCDEVIAVAMLKHIKQYSNATVVRTRDEAVLATADIVVDVGGVYDPDTLRFDHHQREFTGTFAKQGRRSRTKLSSAGLVYKHLGKEVVASVLAKAEIAISDDDLDTVYFKVYDSFVEAVDAVDNGIARFVTTEPPRYDSSTDIGARVGRMNASWNESATSEVQDANFAKAVQFSGAEFDACVVQIAQSWLPARAIVAKAMSTRTADDDAGSLFVMREWAPWKDHLFIIEEEEVANGKTMPVQYVVYQDMTGGSWRIQAVPVNKSSFDSRTPLPEAWRGIRDDALSVLSGIDGCIFVHASGFIGGNKTFDGAMEMARKSLALASAAMG